MHDSCLKNSAIFAFVLKPVNIHTHCPRPDERTITAVGIHPREAEGAHLPAFVEQGVDAIGEIGLDYACNANREEQQRVFEEQLAVAERENLPVVLHCVRAFEPVMRTLARYRLRAVIFHGFIGSVQQMQRAVGAGYFLSFGERTFRSPKTVEALLRTPPERLFFETDDSGAKIEEILHIFAEILHVNTADLIRITNENYERIFQNKI